MKRQIVLDTETTGMKPEEGHRVIEIGAIELIDGKKTNKHFHTYLNPKRPIPAEATNIHGITDAKVKNAPVFEEIAHEFLNFIQGAELLIHNAAFDVNFLISELDKSSKGKLWDYATKATCTLELSKKLFAEERKHNLDSLCQRFNIDNSHRTFHGALLDAELLAEAYLKITEIYPLDQIEADLEQTNWVRPEIKRFSGLKLSTIKISDQEEKAHQLFLQELETKDKVQPVFKTTTNKPRP